MQSLLELADIQGNILSAYGRLGFPKARYLLVNVADAPSGRALVEALRLRVTTALRWASKRSGKAAGANPVTRPAVALNLAFTYRGLVAMGLPTRTLAETKTAIAALQRLGPRIVLVTSVRTTQTPEGCIDMLAAEGDAVHLLRTPALPVHVNGAGDAIAALFLFHRLRTGDVARALALAGSSIWGLLRRTAEAGSREILTVAAQDEFVQPSRMFDTISCQTPQQQPG